MLAGGNKSVQQFNSNPNTAQAMWTAGQSIFLSINIFLLYCILDMIRQLWCEDPSKGMHPTLLLLLVTWPPLFVRGLYGVMSGVLPTFNYLNLGNYGTTGLVDSFVVSEYIVGTMMEWGSCTMPMLTYLTSRNDPKKVDLIYTGDEKRAGRPSSRSVGVWDILSLLGVTPLLFTP